VTFACAGRPKVVASIVLNSTEFKSYREQIGPGLGRPERPAQCPLCDGVRIWFDGWRFVFCVVLADGVPHRFEDGLPLQRVKCAVCKRAWTLRPAFLYPHRGFAPDVSEAAVLSYLSRPEATYKETGQAFGSSARSVWRWVGWSAGLVKAPAVLAEAERLGGSGQSASLVPREVPQDHPKAYSPERERTLVDAFQGLVALAVWSRAQPLPPNDSSPLRFWLAERFRAFRELHRLVPRHPSPPLPVEGTGPPGYRGGRELRRRDG